MAKLLRDDLEEGVSIGSSVSCSDEIAVLESRHDGLVEIDFEVLEREST